MLKRILTHIGLFFKNKTEDAQTNTSTPEEDLNGLSPLSRKIFKHYKIRKTKKQKTEFIAMLSKNIPDITVEISRLKISRNLVIGNIKNAKIIFIAHYDTCVRRLAPNFNTPTKVLLPLIYNIIVSIPYLLPMVVIVICAIRYWGNVLYGLPCLVLLAIWMILRTCIIGTPNPSNANDNTSGIITLCELMRTMSAEEKSKVAFVFLDNEEKGCLGSKFLFKSHKKDGIDNKLVINFDSVADGNHILFSFKELAGRYYQETFSKAFTSDGIRFIYMDNCKKIRMASDHREFSTGVGIASFRWHKKLKYYMTDIHTPKDNNLQIDNIKFLVNGVQNLLRELP